MSSISLDEFSDRVNDMMPRIMKRFLKNESSQFYKVKLTLPQFAVMNLIHITGGSKMTDLARNANVTTAAMTGIVERLVRDSYVARMADPKDRRIVKILLTPKGERTVEKMIDERRAMVKKMFSVVSQADREEYLRILKNVMDGLEKSNE